MITRQTFVFQLSSAFSANAPLTLLTANQPMPADEGRWTPAGQDVAQVAEPDPGKSTICGTPNRRSPGRPARPSTPSRAGTEHEARSVAIQNDRPKNQTPMTPTEDGRELHVRRHPRPELLQGLAVALAERDELGPAGLDRRDLAAVRSLTDLGLR